MREFLTQNLSWILGVVLIAVFVLQAIRLLRRAKQTEQTPEEEAEDDKAN